ncbi:hypothetical protein [Chryseolinea sp. H1M3-3]|uniref:hypothetical protein n=1 Tax=Chryseolinea sp. H1M3-3 TaxID=3034144 RepID=UPI0023EA813E|nr:hypothetical protein [Chryseolinea sp. H1M3-3]
MWRAKGECGVWSVRVSVSVSVSEWVEGKGWRSSSVLFKVCSFEGADPSRRAGRTRGALLRTSVRGGRWAFEGADSFGHRLTGRVGVLNSSVPILFYSILFYSNSIPFLSIGSDFLSGERVMGCGSEGSVAG